MFEATTKNYDGITMWEAVAANHCTSSIDGNLTKP
jgi:hypothetical protein